MISNTNVKVLNAVDMSTDHTSSTIDKRGYSLYSIQYIWTGFSGTATIVTNASNDILAGSPTFTQVDSFIPSGTSGSRILNVEKAGYGLINVVYSQATAAGTLTVIYNSIQE